MRDLERPGRSPAHGMTAMAATSHTLSTQAAIDVMRDGGNAMDAAIAACAVQCVVEPGSTGIGGDCFCLYAPRGAAAPIAFDGSSIAPGAATVAAYAERGATNSIPRQSPLAVTLPGAIDAWSRLHADHGRTPWPKLFEAAIRYARDGYPIASRVARDWEASVALLAADAPSARIFLPEGRPMRVGEVHRQRELAETLQAIAEGGRAAFYEGAVADDMIACLEAHGGVHTRDDLARVAGKYVTPITTSFRGRDVWECPPAGQGAIALLLLNIHAEAPLFDGPLDPRRIHWEIEACRLAYAARTVYVGDPSFSDIDVETLLSPAYAAKLRAQIDPDRARAPLPDPALVRHDDTVYISVVDPEGNVCSFINTLFSNWGAGICAPKSGVVFTNRGQGFSLDPASPNRIEPYKRPLHTIIPGMATEGGRAVMPFGVMGGEYQAMGHAQFLTRMWDYGCDIQEAMDLPRYMADPFTGEVTMEGAVPEETRAALALRGHQIAPPPKPIGGSQAIWRDPATGVLTGGSDPRKDGCAIGW